MKRVMDGVRPTPSKVKPTVLPRRVVEQQAVQAAPRQFAVGLDGVRRLTSPHTPVAATAVENASRRERVLPTRHMRWNLRMPHVPLAKLRRPAASTGLVVMAFVASVFAVHVLSTPRTTTAHAETAAAAHADVPTSSPSASPAVSVIQEQTALQQLLAKFISTYQTDGTYNIVVKDLSTGATATINPDDSYESASLYKLFVADQIYHQIDSGGLTYGAAAGGGSGNTIGGCLELMITISDNTCGRALGSILDWGSQNPALAAEGFTETDLTTPQQTSARDVALLFEDLYNGTLNSSASNLAFLNLLKDQKVNDRLPQGLPAGTVIAHKTGNLDNVVHDGGIIYGPKTNYVVVVMSGGWDEPGHAPAQFAALSSQLWQFFEQ
ncbi:MAG TPA: serine hydrolase [Candidatus Saccharimonadia bacterium]|nr:serine hydrolase [Candidatus Saccharimonadia bacterium]